MKLKVVFASVAVVAIAVVAFAFAAKRTTTTQYLNEAAVSSVEISSLPMSVDNPDNWATGLGYTFANGSKLAAMTFNQELDEDGSGDGELSKEEAVHALYEYYLNNSLPENGSTINVQVDGSEGNAAIAITIRRKS